MPTEPTNPIDPAIPRTLLIVSAWCLGVASAVVGLLFWWMDHALDEAAAEEQECCWQSAITPKWLSSKIVVRIPEGATDLRAGYRVGTRWDEGILAFSLPDAEARKYVARLVPPGHRILDNDAPLDAYTRPDTFDRIGLLDPETIRGSRSLTGGCRDDPPESVEAEHLQTCAEFFSYAFAPGLTRIYVRAHFEPGISPLPQ
ncbi:hypothetical protein AB0G74_13205 [Streptomyces sp. NPDC020875]|uniref:hypothetical protein n=1 Tax=Streptomyces sp. NPDC020875 TaxID=3154898 RepID=UPI0033FB216F